MSKVAIVKHSKSILATLQKGLELIGGLQDLFSPVLLKPNICTLKDGTGHSISDPRVTEAIIDILIAKDKDLCIKIIETDSMSKFADEAFEKLGFKALANRFINKGFDVSVVNLTQSQTKRINFEGIHYTNPELPEELVSPHYYISQAISKTHYLTFLTGAIKNQFGLVQTKKKAALHPEITGIITDLTRIVNPKLCITDARVGVEGWNGPVTRPLDSFVVGYNPVSVDATVTRMMGFDPMKIRHLVECGKHNLGSLNPSVVGEPLEKYTMQFNPPNKLDAMALL